MVAQSAGIAAAAIVMQAAGNPDPTGPYWQTHQRATLEADQAHLLAARTSWLSAGGQGDLFTVFPGNLPGAPSGSQGVPSSSEIPLFPGGNPNMQETQIVPPSLPGAVHQHLQQQQQQQNFQQAPARRERSRDRSRSPRTAAELAAAEEATAAARAAQDEEIADVLRPRDLPDPGVTITSGVPVPRATEATEDSADLPTPSTLE